MHKLVALGSIALVVFVAGCSQPTDTVSNFEATVEAAVAATVAASTVATPASTQLLQGKQASTEVPATASASSPMSTPTPTPVLASTHTPEPTPTPRPVPTATLRKNLLQHLRLCRHPPLHQILLQLQRLRPCRHPPPRRHLRQLQPHHLRPLTLRRSIANWKTFPLMDFNLQAQTVPIAMSRGEYWNGTALIGLPAAVARLDA